MNGDRNDSHDSVQNNTDTDTDGNESHNPADSADGVNNHLVSANSASRSFSLENYIAEIGTSELLRATNNVDPDGRIQSPTATNNTDNKAQSTPDNVQNMTTLLGDDSSEWKMLHLQQLMKYIDTLLPDDDERTNADKLNARKVVSSALRRVAFRLLTATPDNDDYIPVLKYGYISCFKSLMYLEMYDIEFDVNFVVDLVQWQFAYQCISTLCYLYQLRFNEKVHAAYHRLVRSAPNIVKSPLTKMIVNDLKELAHQRGPWASSTRNETGNLYGSHLQDSDDILLAKKYAKNGNIDFSDIDNRVPNTLADTEQEFITFIQAAVSAVDKQFGIERSSEEWSDFRKSLTAYGVCDHDGDLYGNYSITVPDERYGNLNFSVYDLLTPIGFNDTYLSCPEPNKWRLPSTPETSVKSMSYLDPRTVKIVRDDDSEEIIGFFGDVSFVDLPAGVHLVSTDPNNCILYVQYDNPSSIDGRDTKSLDEYTRAIAEKVIPNDLDTPYPSPFGIQSIAFCLTRPWKNWRGIGVANGAASVVTMNDLKTYFESVEKYTAGNVTISWKGYNMDFEVMALGRSVKQIPTSFNLLAYLAHICTHPKFDWDHVSSSSTIEIGRTDIVICSNSEDVEKFINFEKANCYDRFIINEPIDSREGYILVKCRRPWDLFALFLFLFVFSITPAISRPSSRWNDGMSEALQNIGMGMAPILLIYTLARYRGWDVRDMIKGRKKCRTLEDAEKACSMTKEEISMTAKKQKVAKDVFQTVSNSVSLNGREGNGLTSCRGLSAAKLFDFGVLFISKPEDTVPIGMIDMDGYLTLTKESHAEFFSAKPGDLEPGTWKILSRSELEHVRIY